MRQSNVITQPKAATALKIAARAAKAMLIPAKVWARVIAVLWTAICMLILTHTLLKLGASLRVISNALELQMYLMLAMSYPLGGYVYSAIYSVAYNSWGYSDEDIRSILILWSILFVTGYFQWFVLPRAVTAIWRRTMHKDNPKNGDESVADP